VGVDRVDRVAGMEKRMQIDESLPMIRKAFPMLGYNVAFLVHKH
jgi:hypothetical protein